MAALTQDALLAQIAAGDLQPIYLVVGDDEYEKDEIAKAFQAAVPEDIQAFAFERYSAIDTNDPGVVVNSARTLPFLGDRRIIVVTRAEKWFSGKRKGGDDASPDEDDDTGGEDLLEAYFERPEPASTVVFVAADVNRTFRLVKALVKQAVTVECWGLKGEKDPRGPATEALNRAGRLAAGLFKRAGMTIDRDAVEPLLAHAGTDIAILRGDVERLILYCHGRKAVDAGRRRRGRQRHGAAQPLGRRERGGAGRRARGAASDPGGHRRRRGAVHDARADRLVGAEQAAADGIAGPRPGRGGRGVPDGSGDEVVGGRAADSARAAGRRALRPRQVRRRGWGSGSATRRAWP